MVTFFEKAGQPVTGGPLFCACRSGPLGRITAVIFAAFVLAMASTAAIASGTCATRSGAVHEPVQIQRVSDGDTVVLSDGRKVRIIGINAPELSKKSEKTLRTEAINAHKFVEQLAANSASTSLVLGDDPLDRYGRVLAHLFFDNNRSLAEELLSQGLAAATTVHPNSRCAEHNLRIERVARQHRRGVWQYDNNPWFAKQASAQAIKGFHILTSAVENVNKRKRNWEIELANDVVIRAKVKLLSTEYANSLVNKTVEIRGWFGQHNGITSVRLHHRTNLSAQP